jgi:hypothetical protein
MLLMHLSVNKEARIYGFALAPYQQVMELRGTRDAGKHCE